MKGYLLLAKKLLHVIEGAEERIMYRGMGNLAGIRKLMKGHFSAFFFVAANILPHAAVTGAHVFVMLLYQVIKPHGQPPFADDTPDI